MRRAAAFLSVLVLAAACGEERKEKPLSEAGEKLYELKGKIVSRETDDNVVRVDHEAIPGFMESMTMDYSVRGVDVGKLPPDGTRIKAKLHVTQRAYWLTGVTQAP